MDQKAKIIIIVLIAVLGGSFFLNFQTFNAKQALEKQIETLRIDNDSLARKANDAIQESQKLQGRLDAISADLDRFAKEKEDIQQKYDLASKEKQDLIEQLKSLQARKVEAPPAVVPAAQPQQVLPQPGDAYWAGVLKEKTDLELQLQSLRQEFKGLQLNTDQLLKEKNSLALEVSNLNREKADFKRQMDYNQKIMDSIAAELVREKNDKFEIKENIQVIKDENVYLRRQLKTLQDNKISLERKLVDWQEKNTALSNRIYEMESMLKDKMIYIDNLKKELELRKIGKVVSETQKESVELPPIVVRPQGAGAGMEVAALVGKVLAVNRENNFVIIDIGEDAGVKVGTIFTVYKQDKPAAEVQVLQARKNISACDIKKETTPIKVGDVVK